MPDPITSPAAPATRVIATTGAAEPHPAEAQQQVSVRALGSFHADGDMQGTLCAPGDTFSCDRLRASQLRANGLVEYVDEADEKAIHGEIDAKAIASRVEMRKQAGIIADNHKSTPLVHHPLRTKAE